MSEWLELMLEEIERKKEERQDAEAEAARRQCDTEDSGEAPQGK